MRVMDKKKINDTNGKGSQGSNCLLPLNEETDSDDYLSLAEICNEINKTKDNEKNKSNDNKIPEISNIMLAPYFKEYCALYGLNCENYIHHKKYKIPRQIAQDFIRYLDSEDCIIHYAYIVSLLVSQKFTKRNVDYFFENKYLKHRKLQKSDYQIHGKGSSILMTVSEAINFIIQFNTYHNRNKYYHKILEKNPEAYKKSVAENENGLLDEKAISEFSYSLLSDKKIKMLFDQNRLIDADALSININSMRIKIVNTLIKMDKAIEEFLRESFSDSIELLNNQLKQMNTSEGFYALIKNNNLTEELTQKAMDKNKNSLFEKIDSNIIKIAGCQ